jgi:hypothetical protein
MMHGRGKSDEAIVALKPANKAERSAAEPVEPRAEAKGNAGQHTCAGHRAGQACHRRWSAYGKPQENSGSPSHPRWEPYAGKPHVRFCAGGAQQ